MDMRRESVSDQPNVEEEAQVAADMAANVVSNVAAKAEAQAEDYGSSRIAQDLGLYVIPVHDAIPHERYNGERVADLTARIGAEDRLINPPIAVRYSQPTAAENTEHSSRYIILDGATRITAFQHLGYPHIIVQVVDLQTNRVRLDTWQHTLHGDTAENLLAMLGEIEGLRITSVVADRLLGRTPIYPGIGFLFTPDGRGFLLDAQVEHNPPNHNVEWPATEWPTAEWLDVFHRVVDRCGEWGRIERTLSTDMDALRARYPDMAGHFVFHGFEAEEVLNLAARGQAVPAGITRFVIPGRILRLNAPLDRLRAQEPAAAKQAWLDEFLAQKITDRRMRYYEEPVILLDE